MNPCLSEPGSFGKHFSAGRCRSTCNISSLVKHRALLSMVGSRVRSSRERLGWSRRQLSERSGVSERFLAQLEVGEGNISLGRFAEVASALGTTPADLLAGAA